MMFYPYAIAFVFFWIGWSFCAVLSNGRERDDSDGRGLSTPTEPAGEAGLRVEEKPVPRHVLETSPAPAEAVVVGDIIKKKTRVSRAKKNGEVNKCQPSNLS